MNSRCRPRHDGPAGSLLLQDGSYSSLRQAGPTLWKEDPRTRCPTPQEGIDGASVGGRTHRSASSTSILYCTLAILCRNLKLKKKKKHILRLYNCEKVGRYWTREPRAIAPYCRSDTQSFCRSQSGQKNEPYQSNNNCWFRMRLINQLKICFFSQIFIWEKLIV